MKNTIKTNGRKRFTKRVEGEIAGKKRTINYIGNKVVSITTEENGKDVHICKNKYETIFETNNAKFRIPEQSINSMIVDEHSQFIIDDGKIIERLIPACFRSGIILKNDEGKATILTRNFYSQDGPYSLPFGKTVLGAIEVQKCTMHNGEKKLIINYYFGRIYDHKKDGEYKWKEIKITPSPSGKNKFIEKINPTNYFIIIK